VAPLTLLYLVGLLRGLRFGFGVWVLYYLRVTDYAGIGIAETLTILAFFLLEVPTGWLADRFGRKRAILASLLLETLGYLALVAISDLMGLLVSLLILQVGRAFFSGTFEALIYETLLERGEAGLYARILGRISGLQLASTALASLIGGYLYRVDPRLPFLGAAVAFGLASLAAIALREPTSSATLEPKESLTSGRGWNVLRSNAALVAPLLLVSVFLVVPDEVLDDVLAVELGFAPQQLGLLFAVAYLAAAFCASRSSLLAERFGPGRVITVISLVMALSLAATPWSGLAIGGLAIVLRNAGRSVHDTLASSLLNELAPSSHRATVLSSYHALRNAPYVVLAYAIGVAMDLLSARTFAFYFGAAQLLATSPALWLLWRRGSDRLTAA
jgi:MFS family permease